LWRIVLRGVTIRHNSEHGGQRAAELWRIVLRGVTIRHNSDSGGAGLVVGVVDRRMFRAGGAGLASV